MAIRSRRVIFTLAIVSSRLSAFELRQFPSDAEYIKSTKCWKKEYAISENIRCKYLWTADKILKSISCEDRNSKRTQIAYFQANFKLAKTGQYMEIKYRSEKARRYGDDASSILMNFGKWRYYDADGRIQKETCFTAESRWVEEEAVDAVDVPCGLERFRDGTGHQWRTNRHGRKCSQGCGEFRVTMAPGDYRVNASTLHVRDQPKQNAKQIGLLEKGTIVKVIRDTRHVEVISDETAPWVEIEYHGQIGFVFGGFLQLSTIQTSRP